MNMEDPEAMCTLDARLKRLYGGLDTRPGFEDRLQARIVDLAAARVRHPAAEEKARIGREHEQALAAARSAARIDAIALGLGGLGGVLALWRFAPQLSAWYAASVEPLGPTFIGFGSLALTAVALWSLLRRFDVDPRRLAGA